MEISGFTLVRNAVKLDYPFTESVESILPLCDEFVINCGDSEDDTWSRCEALRAKHPKKIRLLQSTWEKDNQTGGYQLKAQTDAALAACQSPWCFYIQADEVVHERDWPFLLDAMERANGLDDVDGVLFNYLHFYGNYSYTIRGRNWYRREVRLIKNNRGIEAFRDAQGFRKQGRRLRVLPSEARVFHYGYVRTVESLRQKAIEMAQWWGEQPKTNFEALQPKRHVGIRRFRHTHPAVMRDRLTSNPPYSPSKSPRSWDRHELKDAISLFWESLFSIRLGEFRNYELA